MKSVVVVGSGASAIEFAAAVLERGWRVTMLDVGRDRPTPVEPDRSFLELIEQYEDVTRYFLGDRFQGVTFPGNAGEYYGFPPHREYIFESHPRYHLQAAGFDPLQSFAKGGLAEAWTGGCFPFNDDELADFPFGYDELGPHYDRVAQRIGIMGQQDDLSQFFPVHENLATPLELDTHGSTLLRRYEKKKSKINADGVWLGRSRMAILAEDRGERKACTKLGRCLWGCPREALYTPALGLSELMSHPSFDYRPGRFVSHFEYDDTGRVTHVVAQRDGADVEAERIEVERLALGAGALASSKIMLDSVHTKTGECWTLEGLMDNRQVLMPFLNLSRLRHRFDAESYQYHQLAFGLADDEPKKYVHGLVTTLKTALIHPIVQSVPLDVVTALKIFKNVHGALGLVNLNFWDDRRATNSVTVEPTEAGTRLDVRYEPPPNENSRTASTMARMRRTLWKLGCIVPPGMAHQRPMGASVHYAGLVPMSRDKKPRTTDTNGRSHDFENLWFIDGATFPYLPAKNLTFSLMANASRIAEAAF